MSDEPTSHSSNGPNDPASDQAKTPATDRLPASPSTQTAQSSPATEATNTSGGSTPAGSNKDGFTTVLSALGKVRLILFAPLVWILRPLVFRVQTEDGVPKVFFTSFSPLLYLWPIMVVGWFGCLLLGWGLVGPHVLGWIWITVVLGVILSIGSDTDRNKTITLVLVVLLLWTAGLLLEAKKGIPILSNIHEFFARQNVTFDPGTARVFSIATLIVLIFVVIAAWFDGRYEITTREITHKRIFRTSDSLPRAAKRIKRDWRDLAEMILGLGAGDLIVLDTNKNIVMRISNVPFLWFFRHDVDHVLEVLATTEAEEAAAIEEEDA